MRMTQEDDSSFTMHDGKSPFKVPKKGLSEEMQKKIRGMGSVKMADGGFAPPLPPPEVSSVDQPVMTENGDDGKYPGFVGRAYEGETPAAAAERLGGSLTGQAKMPGGFVGMAQPGEDLNVAAQRLGGRYIPASQAADITDENIRRKSNGDGDAAFPEAQPAKTEAKPIQGLVAKGEEKAPPAKAAGLGGEKRAPRVDSFGREIDDETGRLIAAKQAEGDLMAVAAGNEAKAAVAKQGVIESDLRKQQEINQRAAIQSKALMARMDEQQAENNKINATVDPGRYWASRSTPGKILGILSLALGALGGAQTGRNSAAEEINKAIDRDIDAQKAEFEQRSRKGGAALQGLQQAYAQNRQIFQDDLAAHSATKAAHLEQAAAQAEELAARTKEGTAKTQQLQTASQLRMEAAKEKNAASVRTTQLSIEQQKADAETAKTHAEIGKLTAKGPSVGAGALAEIAAFRTNLLEKPYSMELGEQRQGVVLSMLKAAGLKNNEANRHAIEAALPETNLLDRGKSLASKLGSEKAKELLDEKFGRANRLIEHMASLPENRADFTGPE